MDDFYDFRIIVIDDNPEIYTDFVKTLTSVDSSEELDSIQDQLFGDTLHEEKPKHNRLLLPKFEIDTAAQGLEGVEKIKEALDEDRAYALAFVDIRMPPGLDGIETVKRIWALDKDIQIVLCSAYSDYSWEETIEELGQTDNLLILKKPFDQIAVRQLACALTRKWKLIQEARQYTESLEQTVKDRTEELLYQATHDSLTKLPNRAYLIEAINKAIKVSKLEHLKFAVLFFDLDRFKLINDSLDHTFGDELLYLVSERISSIISPKDTLARIGGDEFVLVMQDIKTEAEVKKLATTLLTTVREPFTIGGYNFVITASIGICFYPETGTTAHVLIRNADNAMYRAKALGGNQYQLYSEEMKEASLRALELETQLRNAIENDEFVLFFQPQINFKTNEIETVEALIRWQHPTQGLLLPIHFIPLAEEAGLSIPIGNWILRKACNECKKWLDAKLANVRIAVNITAEQINEYGFVAKVKQILDDTKLDPSYLEIELTENAIINHPHNIEVLHELKKLGVRIAMDDFGIGYSNGYLSHLPLDRLKIDRSFINNILINQNDEIIVQAIVAMAASLNLEVLAEGVETKKQIDFLRSSKFKDIQGFYFSHPLSEEDLLSMLKERKLGADKMIQEKLDEDQH